MELWFQQVLGIIHVCGIRQQVPLFVNTQYYITMFCFTKNFTFNKFNLENLQFTYFKKAGVKWLFGFVTHTKIIKLMRQILKFPQKKTIPILFF